MAVAASPMLPVLLMFIAFATATTGTAETKTALDETCAFLGDEYVTPELCTSVLCADPSDPCRAARDAPAVAALAARLAARNATATKGSVEAALAAHAGNATVAKGIASCLKLYAGVVPSLQQAAQSVAAGRYSDGREALHAALFVSGLCEKGMAGNAAALPRENDAFTYMSFVAHAVVAHMVRD
ncbi:hypothetical protein EJB05_00616, partial [Eragrostis curvula]